jgi:hypothetical protein
MSDKVVQFGPFTPQELDSFVRELQLKNIPFEIQKEDEAEKKFKAIDFANVVNQVEYRTEQYLGQIFYITLARTDLPKVAQRLEKLGFPTDIPADPTELKDSDGSEVFMKAKIEKKNFNRRLTALVLIIGLLCLWFIIFAINFSDRS